jgi:hypothetical protein
VKSETENNVTNVRNLVNHLYETDCTLDVFRRKTLDDDQLSTLRHIVELISEARSAAWYLADTLDPCD